MSGTNSALASLTANYTDSEDEELSPVPLTHVVNTGEDNSESESQDGPLSRPPRSVDSGGSGTANTLVSYHLETDLIDDDAIDDLPAGPDRDIPQPDSGLRVPGTTEDLSKSPTVPPHSPFQEAWESVSSEDDLNSSSSSPKKAKLPPEPTGKCSAKLQERFTNMYELKVQGKLNMNAHIQTKKMFRNPSIYEKLISHLDIDEFGTNYPESMFNPHEWTEASYYDELAKIQKTEMDRREKERRDRTKVDFVSGTAKKILAVAPLVSGTGSTAESDLKRKSKWDQRGVMPPLLMTVGPPPPVTLPASIINSVNSAAAKSKTVTISAFGSLPKKK